jgi:phosphatidylinositol kinase/protein kinase (PI-3  family)
MLDGFGITGAEGKFDYVKHTRCYRYCLRLTSGVFRIACEITMGLLRENKDTLMTVLDAFIHDPLVEWEDEKRKIVSSEEIWF